VKLPRIRSKHDEANPPDAQSRLQGFGNRFEALEPVRQGVLRHFGRTEKDTAKGLALRHDHGSNTMSGDFQDEIAFLGVENSPSSSTSRRAMASLNDLSAP
jgi:hypothetical protein